MMCKLNRGMDNLGHYDVEMKGWMQNWGFIMCKLRGWMEDAHYMEIKSWMEKVVL